MTSVNSISHRSEEIQDLIMSDMVKDATKRLLDFVRDFAQAKTYLQQAIVICSIHTRLEKQVNAGMLEFDEAEGQRNKLLFQILGLLDDIQMEYATKLAA
ncbi:MAG: hypothetical protein AAF502_10960 [Bacteroidota bacterium]